MSKNIVEVLTRAEKGQSLTYEEMDANLLNLLQKAEDAVARFDPEKLSGTLNIDITGKAKGISGVLPIDQGGTGVTDPHSLLQVIGAYPATNPQGYVRANDLPAPVTRPSDIGLGNVNNTADLDKPVSYPMQDALSFKEDKNKKNAAFGYAGLSNFNIVVPSFDGKVNSVFESQAISSRKYTLPDKNIIVAGLEDITGINSGTNTGDETQASIMLKLGVTTLSGSNTGDQTLESLGIPNVANKSPSEILNMIASSHVTNALGFVPFSATQMQAWKGKAMGLAELDKDGYLRAEQIPPSLNNARAFQGLWNAGVNSPPIASGFGTNGYYYKVSVAGTTDVDGTNVWNVGDVIQYVDTKWVRIAADQSSVLSVNGKIGNLTLTASDITGFAPSATTDTTDANNITKGKFNPSLFPAFDGDVASAAGSTTLLLKNTNVTAGAYGKTDKVATFNVDSKGRLVSAGEVAISIEWTAVKNRPNTLADFQITDALSTSLLGQPNGVATLGSNRIIPAQQLPAWAQPDLYVKSVTGNSIVKVDNITDHLNPTISITQATSTTSGYLSKDDWLAFNAKQPALGYTPINSNLIGVANGLATLDASGNLSAPGYFALNRQSKTATGLQWFSASMNAWTDYMGQAGVVGQGPKGNLTPQAGQIVTTWGRRSFIENYQGYGWTFESGAVDSTTPTVVAEISSVDGSARFAGSMTASGFNGSGAGLTGTAGSLNIGGNAASANVSTSTLGMAVVDDNNRDANAIVPISYGHSLRVNFVNSSTAGSPGSLYSGLMTFAPWDGTVQSTGDNSYQLAFGSNARNGSVPDLKMRTGYDSIWKDWHTLLHSGNYTNYSPTLTGVGASGTWNINIEGYSKAIVDAAGGSVMKFNWSGKTGSPVWLWGGNSPDNMYVFSPAELNVGNSAQLGGVPASHHLKVSYQNPPTFFQSASLAPGLYTTNSTGLLDQNGVPYLTGWWHVLVFAHDGGGYGAQIATELSSDQGNGENAPRMYMRVATLGNFGPWAPIDTTRMVSHSGGSLSAKINDFVVCSGSDANIVLPANPLPGDKITVCRPLSTSPNVFLYRNGKKIHGVADDYQVDYAPITLTLRYTDDINGWIFE